MSQLQRCKLTNERLEDEKAELLHEIRKLKGHSVAEDYVSRIFMITSSTLDNIIYHFFISFSDALWTNWQLEAKLQICSAALKSILASNTVLEQIFGLNNSSPLSPLMQQNHNSDIKYIYILMLLLLF